MQPNLTTPQHLMQLNLTTLKHLIQLNLTTLKHLMLLNLTTPKRLTQRNHTTPQQLMVQSRTKTIPHMQASQNTPQNPITSPLKLVLTKGRAHQEVELRNTIKADLQKRGHRQRAPRRQLQLLPQRREQERRPVLHQRNRIKRAGVRVGR